MPYFPVRVRTRAFGRSRQCSRSASCHGMPPGRRVATGHVMLELALDVANERAGAKAEQVRLQPARPQLLLHQQHPFDRLLRAANSARRFEAYAMARALEVLPDRRSEER